MTISVYTQRILDNISQDGIKAFQRSHIIVDGEMSTDEVMFERFRSEVESIDDKLTDKDFRDLLNEMRFKERVK